MRGSEAAAFFGAAKAGVARAANALPARRIAMKLKFEMLDMKSPALARRSTPRGGINLRKLYLVNRD